MSTNPIVPLPPVEVAPAQMVPVSRRPQAVEIAAWALLAALLMFVLFEHLVSAAVVALALYGILEGVTKRMSRRLGSTARPPAVVVVTMPPAGPVVGATPPMGTMARHGASLPVFTHLASGREAVWQADPAQGALHAPLLVPIWGKLPDDT